MAEPTKIKIYNFGDRKLDYGKYLTNLENNVESYLLNQRDTEGWDDNRVQEFRNSFGEIISNFKDDYLGAGTRFSTNQMGAITDAEGVLTNTDSDDFYYNKKGEQINREKYDALKDRKKRKYSSFEANREVAEYFRRIGSYMKDYEDTTEKFDLAKHGFNKWLMDREAPGGTFNYQNYWDLDPANATTGKRDVKNRAKQAKTWMDAYINDMKGRNDLSFEGNKSFSSLDDYLKKAQEVADQWGNPKWDANDRIAAQRLGVDNDFMTKFFGTEGDPNLSPELNAEVARQREEQEKIKKEQLTIEDQQRADDDWVRQQGAKYKLAGYKYTFNSPYRTNAIEMKKYYNYEDNSITEDWDKLKDSYQGNFDVDAAQYIANFYNPYYTPRYTPLDHYIFLPFILNNFGERLEDGNYFIPNIDPKSPSRRHNSALIYNPKLNYLYHVFIGDVPSEWERRKREYIGGNLDEFSGYFFKRKDGGVLKAQSGAELIARAREEYEYGRRTARQQRLEETAKAKGRTVEQQEAAERPLSEGFSTADKARIAGALADITAAISAFVPGYGTAVSGVAGIGSTLVNFGADWADDSVSAGLMWKNFGMNLGMDVLGLVPYGGAAGKFTKIARNIGKYIPRLIAAIGTSAALYNKDEILNSFKKALNDPANLTVGDWQNISQGIGVATGLTAGAGRAVLKKAKETNSSTNFAAIRLQSKSNPKSKVNKIVDAKTAADLRAATTNDEIRLVLKRDYPHLLENYDIEIRKGLYGRPFSPSWKERRLFKTDPLTRIYEVRRDSKGNLYGYNGKWKSDLALYTTYGKAKQQYKKSPLTVGTMPWGERDAYLRDFNKVRRFTSEDADFQDARWRSEEELLNTPHKQRLLEDANARRTNEIEYLKPFRDQHGSTGDITNRLNTSRTLKNSPDYQTAVGQHAALTQQHADLVARHQPMIDSYKQQIRLIDNDLLFYNDQRTSANPKDRAFANREIKRLTKLRQQLQTEHDTLSAELLASETKVKDNQSRIDAGSDTRIQELEALESQSKAHDETLANIDKEISRLEQLGGAHTPSYLELMNKRAKDGKITFTDERGQQFTVDAVRAMRLAGIKRNGGILDAVEKFQNSGKIKSPMRDVLNKGNVNWYTDMFTNGLNATKTGEDGVALPNWFDKWKIDDPIYNPDKFNQLLTDWYNNLQATGYLEGSNKAVRNPGVEKRQPDWEATGGNAPIADMLKPGPNGESPRLIGNGGTEDKPDESGKFGTDGVFGQQEYLRHAGRASDWEGKDTELAEFNKKLAERGLVYEKDRSGNTDMMMLYKLNATTDGPEKASTKTAPTSKKTTSINVPGKKQNELKTNNGIIFNKSRQYLGDPDLLANLLLFGTLNQIDDEVDLQRKKQPHLLQVGEDTKYVRKNNYAIYNARRAQGLLMHMASQPIISDGGKLMAYAADLFTKMLDYGLQGNQLADEKFWETMDAEKELRMKSRKDREDTANANSRTLAEHQHDWINTLLVARYKKWNANNTRLMEMRTKMEGKIAEAEAAQKSADRMMLESDVTFNLQKYADQFGITPEEIEVWNKVQAGTTTPSGLSAEDKSKWESVYRKVQIGKQLLSAQQSGADISAYANVRAMTKPTTSTNPTAHTNAPSYVQLKKDGGKTQAKARVKVAKIRERIKNADRAAKAMEKNLDRVQKTVESINKRMYGIKR